VFDEDFVFEVPCPDISCLLFVVNNKTASDSFVGYYSIPLGAARSGYRRIPLKDSTGHVLPDSSLFVNVSRKQNQIQTVKSLKWKNK